MEGSTVVAGRYRLVALAGRGASGSVYRAEDLHDGTLAALKLVEARDEVDARRFLREARVLAQLEHPGIVRYRGQGLAADGRLFLAMDWLDGLSLEDSLKEKAPTVPEVVVLGERLAAALEIVHSAAIVHRDLKPANIVLPSGEVKRATLVDFGVAHISDSRRSTSTLTKTGAVVGTPFYLAPEQASGRKVDSRTDLYALGCVLFECLTGRPPFLGDTFVALLARILFEPPPALDDLRPGLPEALTHLVHGLLSKKAEDRPDDAAAVQRALSIIAADGAGPSGVGEPTSDRDRADFDAAPAAVVTTHEVRVVSVLAISFEADVPVAEEELRRLSDQHGAELERLLDGSLLGVVRGVADAFGEQALRAARLSLAVRRAHPRARISLATGRGVHSAAGPVGEAVDRAASALRDCQAGVITVDDATVTLLRGRCAFDESGELSELIRTSSGTVLLGRATPFVGRRRELALLTATLEECVEESTAHALVLIGETGLGKSRLVRELVERAEAEFGASSVLLSAAGDPMTTGSSYAMMAAAFTRALRFSATDSVEARRDKLRARIDARMEPDSARRTAALLGELAGLPPNEAFDDELRALKQDPRVFQEELRRAFTAWVLAECAVGPRIIVLEDVHWGDVATVALIDDLLSHARDAPLLVVALARPEVRDLFPTLFRTHETTEFVLSRLGRSACARLVRHALDGVETAQVDRLVDRADGNAFFLEELIRAASASSSGADDHLPDTILGLVDARLSTLDAKARRILRAGSVFGEVFWSGGVEALAGADAAAAEWLPVLCASEVITRRASSRFAGQDEYKFRHALLRDTAYAALTGDDRLRGHLRAAGWLAASGERDAALLAGHCERGGAPADAARWHGRAAKDRLRAHDLRGTLVSAQAAETCGASGASLGEVELLRCESLIWMGRPAEALPAAERALGLLSPGSTNWFSAVADHGDACLQLGIADGALVWLDRLWAAAAEDVDHADSAIACLGRVAFGLVLLGHRDAGERTLDLAAARLRRSPNASPLSRAHVQHAEAARAMVAGELEVAAEGYARAAETFETVGALRLASGARNNVGAVYLELGGSVQAIEALERAFGAAERARSAYAESLARLNLGIALTRHGAAEEGRAHLLGAATAFAAQGDRRLEASARCALAEALVMSGALVDGEAEARQAWQCAEGLDSARASACATLAHVLIRKGATDEALAMAEEGMALRESTSLEERDVLLQLSYAEALAQVGRREAAQEILTTLLVDLTDRASRIASPALSRAFVEDVPDNARAFALAQELDLGPLNRPTLPGRGRLPS